MHDARVPRFLPALVLLLATCAPRPAATLIPEVELPGADGGAPDAGPRCDCAVWGNPRPVGTIGAPLDELSGLVASRRQPGVLFAHNDSGDTARFFALAGTGAILEEYTLEGVPARDWEDVALGPCPEGTCLSLGDIGDNSEVRTDYAVYRVPEPMVGDAGVVSVGWVRLGYEFPGKARHNAEALLAHPVTGRLYLITKPVTGPSEVYRFPAEPSATESSVLELVATLAVPGAADRPLTAADVNPCGTAVLLRMYNRLVELRLPVGATDFEALFTQEPVTVPSAQEPQGEAVAYGPDGVTYFTASEKLVGAPPLYEHRCR